MRQFGWWTVMTKRKAAARKKRCWPAALVLVVGVVSACAPTPLVDDPYQFDDQHDSAADYQRWFDGETPDLEAPATPEEWFLAGESKFWDGDYQGAYSAYVTMLQDHPGHALNRFAAERLNRMRNEIPDFAQRVTADLEDVSYHREETLTRVEMARLSYRASRHQWHRSEAGEPFDFRHAGLIDTWSATPALSPWPMLDFDEPMAPETSDRLSRQYRSPLVAGADPANWEPTRVISVDGLRDRLRLGSRGVYYLEAQLQVEPDPDPEVDADEPREITVSGRFPGPARVWIGDQELLEDGNDDYETAWLLRQVELEPGTHRVLVKLGYDPSVADWFELLWIPESGPVFGDAGINSHHRVDEPDGTVRARGPAHGAQELEPVRPALDELEDISSPMLYAAAVGAYTSGATQLFSAAHEALMERHPEFAPGFVLASWQVRTRADLPPETRESRAISQLRRAQQLQPDNLMVLVELERRLRDSGSDEEYRQLVQRARQIAIGAGEGSTEQEEFNGQARHNPPRLRPLVAWAEYLDRQGWSTDAEQAWQQVLDVDDGSCRTMRRLHRLYRDRHYLPEPGQLSEHADSCPWLVDRWLQDQPGRLDERVELAQRQAQRYPYNVARQIDLASVLRADGRRDDAAQVLDEAIDRMPWQRRLWEERIELVLGDGDDDLAEKLLDEVTYRAGRSARLEWLRARLNDEMPLEPFLRDGRQAALEEVRRTGEGDAVDKLDDADQADQAMVLDDAYYVVDFTGRKYFEDGSAWSLTHQVVRVMTRGAIDDYAEMSVPGGAELLKIRTIKEDGEVRIPDGVTGDSTLSMPGLSRGDMVEIAYLQFEPASRVASRINGRRFYFQMPDVSSRLSEYLVLGADELEFESANGAPEPESVEFNGVQGVRFVAEDIRRPRSEARRVSSQDYLPWVREIRDGVDGHMLDYERRYMSNAIRTSARMAPYVEEAFEQWLGAAVDEVDVDDETVKRLFYEASDWFRSAVPGRFSVDVVHALQRRRGSPLVAMYLALQQMDVNADIYIARTDEQPQNIQRVGEIDRYPRAVLRVEMPDSGEVKWVKPDRRTAMFGALAPEIVGENAICISCDSYREETVTMDEQLRPRRHIDLEATLDEEGTLTGTMSYEMKGVRAARVRSALRGRTEQQDRQDYFERVLTDQLSGADLTGYQVHNEEESAEPLRFDIEFQRTGFARDSSDGLVVDRPLFRESMQRVYAREATRRTPLRVGYEREQSYRVRIELPEQMGLDVDDVEVVAESSFGDYERRVRGDDNVFAIDASIRLPRQRVEPEDYDRFRDWTRTVEESGRVWFRVE